MLSSIHPLGERARHNRWGVTAAAFTAGAIASGALIGTALGTVGTVAPWHAADPARTVSIGFIAVVAAILDLARVRPPGPRRQVDEGWVGAYRGWVYGLAFGAQLGAGVATFVVTWAVWALLVAEIVIGSPLAGAIVGATFGLGRSVGLLAAGWIDRPGRLVSFHRTMQRIAAPTHRAAAVAIGAVGLAVIVAGVG